ncbi:cell wall hydrolase [Phenylobacterium sp.]|uniref:cell wall hydrolase n=1 Tax=Phenylobacterium sp. TaxID=1871053 RepID=UPI0025FAEE7E|nr:cell wall hydrolase [Phenylobacterium sp.]
MQFNTKVLAAWRAPFSAALAGSGVGLGLGALFLAAGMSGQAADHARALRMAEAAAVGYSGSYLEAEGQGLRFGLERYALGAGADAQTVANRFANDRGAAKARQRADLECLTEAVYYEARGESARGQAAVAQVVMNRVKHPAFPKSVCAVVFQGAGRSGCQFSFACDGSMKRRRETLAWNRARDVAARALSGALRGEIGSATHFHTTAVSPAWAPQMLRVANVGTHVFYRFSPYRLRVAPATAPAVEHAVLTSGEVAAAPELRLMPALVNEKAVAESLEPVSATAPAAAKPAAAIAPAAKPAAKPAEAAALTSPPSLVAAAS